MVSALFELASDPVESLLLPTPGPTHLPVRGINGTHKKYQTKKKSLFLVTGPKKLGQAVR